MNGKQNFTAVVVNDDLIQLDFLRTLLEKGGINTQVFETAEKALAVMDQEHPPDLIVTDLYMPGIDGWRFCRLLRSLEFAAFNAVPILVVSATFAGEEATRITKELGADAFLPLPVDGPHFLRVVRDLMQGDREKTLQQKHLRALVVEDSGTVAGLLRKAFEAHGWLADISSTVMESTKAMGGSSYDAAVIDYHLPDGKGDEVLAGIRVSQPDCICIMMTTDPSPKLALAWMKQGASAYVRKPFDPEYLIELCVRALREKAMLRVENLLDTRSRQLQKSEERWRKLIRHSSDILIILDENGIERYVSDSVERVTGFPPERFLGEECFQFLHPDDQPPIMEAFRKALQNPGIPVRGSYRHQHRNGGWVHLEAIGTNLLHDSDIQGIVLHVRDNTEKIQAEQELRNADERLRRLVKNSSDIIVIINADGMQRYVSPAAEWITGYSPEELTGRSLTEIIHPDDMPALQRAWNEAIKTPDRTMKVEYRHIHKTHEWVHLEAVGQSFLDDPLVQGVIASVRDITERKETESRLHLHHLVLEQIHDHVTITDLNGFITYVNDAVLKNTGYAREDLIGESVVKYGEDPQRGAGQRELVEETLRNGHWRGEVVNRTADGRDLILDCQTQVVLDEQGKKIALCGIATDITERKRDEEEREKLQAQLNQAQKMESVGRLAGGVAHDFNNMLTVILGQTEMALMNVTPTDPLHGRLRKIQESAGRSTELVRQLLAFARKQTIAPRVVDLNQAVEGILKMLKRLIGEDVHLAFWPAPNLWRVKIDPSQVDQILANLCVNARDALGDVGKIEIRTENAIFEACDCVGRKDFLPGEYVMLSVSDNGCGMDSEILEKVFEPFFTTKEAGKGTGLGLSTVYGAVKQNNGFLHAVSKPAEGTIFRIYLPRYAGSIEPAGRLKAEQQIQGGHETVLLVEDEATVLEINQALLENFGYRVLTATTPAEALEIAEKQNGRIDLLATDVVMPEMNGRELAERLRNLCPNLKCLFMSGYPSDVIAHQGVLEEGVCFLQKPFSMKAFADKVREALER